MKVSNHWVCAGFWIYLLGAIIGPFLLYLWYWFLQPHQAYYTKDPAADILWLSDVQKKRMNVHFNREKRVWDFWRQQIDLFFAIRFYVSVISVVAPVLLAALAPLSKYDHVEWLLSLMSIHLAITVGLYKTLRVGRTVQEGVVFENEFYALFWSFQDEVIDPAASEERIAKYLADYTKIRKRAFRGEITTLPNPHEQS